MSTYPGRTVRGSLPRRKERRRERRECTASVNARLIGEVICDLLHQGVAKGVKLKDGVSAAIKKAGFDNCVVRVVKGEVHAFIGSLSDRLHGHVIVPIRKKVVRYSRGYAMPHGQWNHYRN